MRVLPAVLSLITLASGVCAFACQATTIGSGNGKACTEMACGNEGVRVEFTFKDPGSYAVDVTIDGAKTTCLASIPLSMNDTGSDACSDAGIYLTRSGAALDVSQQFIGGLTISNKNARSITVRITRDAAVLEDVTFTPAYKTTPGPNGPECEPKECKGAVFTVP